MNYYKSRCKENSACNDERNEKLRAPKTHHQVHVRNWKLMAMIAKHYMKWMSDSNLIEYMWPNPDTILYIGQCHSDNRFVRVPVKIDNRWAALIRHLHNIPTIPNEIYTFKCSIQTNVIGFRTVQIVWSGHHEKNTRRFAWFVLEICKKKKLISL